MSKNYNLSVLTKGIIKENPVLRLVLGTCPTLAVTTAAINGIGMGVAATLVLLGSNIVISLLRNVIPDKVRIPAFITIIAAFVTIIQMLVKAFLPEIDSALGIFLPLIVVNCIILARAEMFASKNPMLPSILDAIGMGIGFTAALTLMGMIRELIGAGTIFGLPVTQQFIDPMIVLILPPGGFFVFGILVALSNKLAVAMGKKPVTKLGCGGNCKGCAGCSEEICEENTVSEASNIPDVNKLASTAGNSDEAKAATKMAEVNVTNADIAENVGEEYPKTEETTEVAADNDSVLEAADVKEREVPSSEETDRTKEGTKSLPLDGNPSKESRTEGDTETNSDESEVKGNE